MTVRFPTAPRAPFVSLVLAASLVLPVLLVGCRREPGPSGDVRPPVNEPARASKMGFPVRSQLVLAKQPGPGGVADLELQLENTLPEGCTVEVELRLPGRVPLEKGKARSSHALGARGHAKIPFRVKIPDQGRHVIEAVVRLPNPEGIPATGGTTLVINPGAPAKPGAEAVFVRTKDGKDLHITVTE